MSEVRGLSWNRNVQRCTCTHLAEYLYRATYQLETLSNTLQAVVLIVRTIRALQCVRVKSTTVVT